MGDKNKEKKKKTFKGFVIKFFLMIILLAVVAGAVIYQFFPDMVPGPVKEYTQGMTDKAKEKYDEIDKEHFDDGEHDLWQTSPYDIKRKYKAFILSFDSDDDDDGDGRPDFRSQPDFVAYKLSKAAGQLEPAPAEPTRIVTDIDLFKKGFAADDASYQNSEYARAFMCPPRHAWRLGEEAAKETHTVLNVCPMSDRLKSGIWKDLEDKCAKWADDYGAVWVITGPIFGDKKENIGGGSDKTVAVPEAFFKLVVRKADDGPEVLSFIYPNGPVGKQLITRKYNHEEYLVTIDEIEKKTGLDFFGKTDEAFQGQLEAGKPKEIWE